MELVCPNLLTGDWSLDGMTKRICTL